MADIHVCATVRGIVSYDRIPLIVNSGNVLHREMRDGRANVNKRHQQDIILGECLLVFLMPTADFCHNYHPTKFSISFFSEFSIQRPGISIRN